MLPQLQVRVGWCSAMEVMISPVSCCSFTEEILCKSLRALKEALSRDAFRYHLNPCDPKKKHPLGYYGFHTTTLSDSFLLFLSLWRKLFSQTTGGESLYKNTRRALLYWVYWDFSVSQLQLKIRTEADVSAERNVSSHVCCDRSSASRAPGEKHRCRCRKTAPCFM